MPDGRFTLRREGREYVAIAPDGTEYRGGDDVVFDDGTGNWSAGVVDPILNPERSSDGTIRTIVVENDELFRHVSPDQVGKGGDGVDWRPEEMVPEDYYARAHEPPRVKSWDDDEQAWVVGGVVYRPDDAVEVSIDGEPRRGYFVAGMEDVSDYAPYVTYEDAEYPTDRERVDAYEGQDDAIRGLIPLYRNGSPGFFWYRPENVTVVDAPEESRHYRTPSSTGVFPMQKTSLKSWDEQGGFWVLNNGQRLKPGTRVSGTLVEGPRGVHTATVATYEQYLADSGGEHPQHHGVDDKPVRNDYTGQAVPVILDDTGEFAAIYHWQLRGKSVGPDGWRKSADDNATTEAGFVADIVENFHDGDRDTMLIFADWLEDQGRPAEAVYFRQEEPFLVDLVRESGQPTDDEFKDEIVQVPNPNSWLDTVGWIAQYDFLYLDDSGYFDLETEVSNDGGEDERYSMTISGIDQAELPPVVVTILRQITGV